MPYLLANSYWFSLGSDGKRNVMISARSFSYADRSVRKWQSISESRFRVAAKMFDISNLKIRIKIKPQLLLAGENYGVYLVFKLFKPGKCLAKHMYVNLKYKWESNNLHADFATLRKDGWMMIELCHILNYEEDTDFEVVLLEEVQSENKICSILSEMKADPYNAWLQEFSTSRNKSRSISFIRPSVESSFEGDIELSKGQVFGIKGKIESQMLSPNTEYMCYLVFKLSETCHGLHCPVKVRHGLQWKNKEIGLICFRPQIPWNLPDTSGVPRVRDDGYMEVIVWKFNSDSELENDHIPMNLKFITYEGTVTPRCSGNTELTK